MDMNKTLDELWHKAGKQPFRAVSATADVYVHGRARNESCPNFICERRDGDVDRHYAHNACWAAYTEPAKQLPHWQAVIYDGITYAMSDRLFSDAAKAEGWIGDAFVRLATEHPPIILEEKLL